MQLHSVPACLQVSLVKLTNSCTEQLQTMFHRIFAYEQHRSQTSRLSDIGEHEELFARQASTAFETASDSALMHY